MKTSSSILVTMVLLAVAALSAPGVYAFGNPITNHAHVPDHFLTYPFTTPASSKKTPKLPLRRQNRALRSMWSPKQDQLDDGKHSHSQHNDNQPHHLIADGKRALSEKTGFPLPPVPTTLSNLKATAKTGKSKTPFSTTAMSSSVPGDNKTKPINSLFTVENTKNCGLARSLSSCHFLPESMRAHFVLLAAAAVFLATSDVASADQTKLSQVATPQSIDTAHVATKRFLRSDKYELSGVEEERGVGALDDVIVKAGKTKMSNDALKKLMTPQVLDNALADINMKFFKELYTGKVSLTRLSKAIKNNPNKEKILQSYNWFRSFHIAQAKARTAV